MRKETFQKQPKKDNEVPAEPEIPKVEGNTEEEEDIERVLDSKRRQAEEAEELSRLLIESDKNKDNQPEVPESHPSVEAIEVPLDVLNGIEDSLAKAKLNAGNK